MGVEGGEIKSKDCTDPCPMAVLQINAALHSHRHIKSAGSFSKTRCSEGRSKAGHQSEEKNITSVVGRREGECWTKAEGKGGGGMEGMPTPSFLLRGGELLHPSDLVQQL